MQTINGFVWFLNQTITVGGLGLFWFVGGTAILLVIAIWKFPKDLVAQRRIHYLLALPAYWIFTGLWGSHFWYDWQGGGPLNSRWVSWPVTGSLVLFFITLIGLIVLLRRARVLTIAFGLWNLYFLLSMSLLAQMAISGAWM